jgi:tyrosinase
MYLGYFEKIVAATVGQLGGPEDWALPYWNYSSATASGTLPGAFFQAQTPDQVANPLLEPNRDSGNDGQPFLPASDVDVTNALREPRFQADLQGGSSGFGGPRTQFSHRHGPHGALEQIPHDLVHDDVGGLMGDPETAGCDPIFWLHHANIDRLWEVWRNTTPPHQNLTDSSWLRFSFKFNDGSGNVQTLAPQMSLIPKRPRFTINTRIFRSLLLRRSRSFRRRPRGL